MDKDTDPELVDAEIGRLHIELKRLDPRDPIDAVSWVEYGRLRWVRYTRRRYVEGKPPGRADLHAVIHAFGRVSTVFCAFAEPHDEAWLLGLLGDALRERHSNGFGSPSDLDWAIELMVRALSGLHKGSPLWFDRAEELAGLYIDRYHVTAAVDDFEAARGAYHCLLATPGRNTAETAYAWSELGFVHAMRYEQERDPTDREQAIDAFGTAWRHGANGPPLASSYADLLIDRGEADWRYEPDRRDGDFRLAVEVLHVAMADSDLSADNRATLDRRALKAHFNRYLASVDSNGHGDEGELLAAAFHWSAVVDNPASQDGPAEIAGLLRSLSVMEHAQVVEDARADGRADVEATRQRTAAVSALQALVSGR